MGRNKTTEGSHNKKTSIYKPERIFRPQNNNKQSTLFKFLKYSRDVDNNEDSRQNEIKPCEEFDREGTEEPIYNNSDSDVNSSSDEDLDVDLNEEETSKDKIDREVPNYLIKGNSYFSAHQIQEKWESKIPFAKHSTKERGQLCKVCAEYREGTEQWKTVAVKQHEHRTRTFLGHENSKRHVNALKKQREIRKVSTKGTIYKQMIDGEKRQTLSTSEETEG